jgi:hypothetical protein
MFASNPDTSPLHTMQNNPAPPTERPSVAIITAAYNSALYLEDCVRSVQNQKITPALHLIINDGSSDNTLSLAKTLQAHYRRVPIIVLDSERNAGAAAARNRAISSCDTDFIGILDADDVALPDWLSTCLPTFVASTSIAAVGGGSVSMSPDGEPLIASAPNDEKLDATARARAGRAPFNHPGTVFRRDAVLSVGGYDISKKAAHDLDLFFRLAANHRLINLARPLIYYRIHSESISYRLRDLQQCTAQSIQQKARHSYLQAHEPSGRNGKQLGSRSGNRYAKTRTTAAAASYTLGLHNILAGNNKRGRRLLIEAVSQDPSLLTRAIRLLALCWLQPLPFWIYRRRYKSHTHIWRAECWPMGD